MDKNRIQLRSVSNVAASKTALIDLPIGLRYHTVILQHGYASGTNTIAAAATNITEIRVKVNGRVQRTISGTQLRDMNLLNGTAFDAVAGEAPNTAPGVSFPIFFAEPWRQVPAEADGMAWPSSGWDSFQIEVDLGAASTPTLAAFAVTDNLAASSKGAGIVKWIRQSWGASGTSLDIATIDKRDFLQQISLYPGGQNATKVTLRKDGIVRHELTATANAALLNQSQMTPAASGRTSGIYDVVLDHDGLLGSALVLDGSRDLTLTVEAASAMSGTITAIVQRFGPPE